MEGQNGGKSRWKGGEGRREWKDEMGGGGSRWKGGEGKRGEIREGRGKEEQGMREGEGTTRGRGWKGGGGGEGDVYLCCGGLWVDDVISCTVQWGRQQLVNSAAHGGGICVI